MLRVRTRPGLGIIEPCLPSPAKAPPSGPGWLHEIKHDGFRIMARRDGAGIRLITRNGNDFTDRFPIIVAAVTALPARSFLIDGEAIVTNGDGLAVFDLIRHTRHGGAAVLCAFDLIELDGEDLRRSSIEYRKRKLAKLLRRPELGIALNEHYQGDGEIIFKHACKLGHSGQSVAYVFFEHSRRSADKIAWTNVRFLGAHILIFQEFSTLPPTPSPNLLAAPRANAPGDDISDTARCN
jgi:ATP-dependent DNA ligase